MKMSPPEYQTNIVRNLEETQSTPATKKFDLLSSAIRLPPSNRAAWLAALPWRRDGVGAAGVNTVTAPRNAAFGQPSSSAHPLGIAWLAQIFA